MIKAIITDFDGTLVDTFEANFKAYQKSFEDAGLVLTQEEYKRCFGLRFDRFMEELGILDRSIIEQIKEAKKHYYPNFFNLLKPNIPLIELVRTFHVSGGRTALASTARKENLIKVLDYLAINNIFDVIYAGFDVVCGKPSPEIYLKTMDAIGKRAEETLIFEDSAIGLAAAKASGAFYMIVSPNQFV